MARHVPMKTWTISTGSPSLVWGIIPINTVGEFFLKTDGTLFDLDDNWAITASGTIKEGIKLKGTIHLDIQNYNGYTVSIFGTALDPEFLDEPLLVEVLFDGNGTANVTFTSLQTDEPTISTLANIEDVETYNPLTLDDKSILIFNSTTHTWETQVLTQLVTYTANNLITGVTNIAVFNKSIAYGAYVDYVILTTLNVPIRVGTVYVVWNTSTSDCMDYCTKDITGVSTSFKIDAAVSGSYLSIRANITSGTFNVKLSIRYI